MSDYAKVTVAALAIVPGPQETVTFIRQIRGPFAGHLLLPGGRVEFGEGLADAARREAWEKSGCVLGEMELTGVCEMRGSWAQGGYSVVMFAFLAAGPAVVPEGFQGDVGGVMQVPPGSVRPHPTVMRILNDAGAGVYWSADIEAGLVTEHVSMTSHPLAYLGSDPDSVAPAAEAGGRSNIGMMFLAGVACVLATLRWRV